METKSPAEAALLALLSRPGLTYNPLDEDRNEIRILTILPAKRQISVNKSPDILSCELRVVSLNEYTEEYVSYYTNLEPVRRRPGLVHVGWRQYIAALQDKSTFFWPVDQKRFLRFKWGDYFALSYTWGDATQRRIIKVNGVDISVTTNLEDALRSVRDTQKLKPGMGIWVDALCINQYNIQERNQQVKRMQSIFTHAQTVLVWLGKAADGSDDAIDLIKDTSAFLQADNDLPDIKPSTRPQQCADEIVHKASWPALLDFFTRPYWSRAWIIQELAAGQDWMTFTCGKKEIDLCSLIHVASFMQHWLSNEKFILAFKSCKASAATKNKLRKIESTLQLLRSMKSLQFASQASEYDRTESQLADDRHMGKKRPALLDELYEILALSFNASTTLDVDKVYGILCILGIKVSRMVLVDYELPVEAVFKSLTNALLAGTQDLRVIYCGGRKDRLLPSWVIDLHTRVDRTMLLNYEPTCALALIKAAFSQDIAFGDQRNYLEVKGYKIDSIEAFTTGVKPLSSTQSQHDILTDTSCISTRCEGNLNDEALRETWYETMLFGIPTTLRARGSLFDVPWYDDEVPTSTLESMNTLDWGQILHTSWYTQFHGFRRANANFEFCGRQLSQLFAQEVSVCRYPDGMMDALKKFAMVMRGRKIVTTEGGFLGCAVEEARHGDQLFLLQGCRIPSYFELRVNTLRLLARVSWVRRLACILRI